MAFTAFAANEPGSVEKEQQPQVSTMVQKLPKRHFMVYYRAWRDVAMHGVNTDLPDKNWISMYDIPYGIDVVNVFSYVPPGQEAKAKPFYDKLKKEYVPYLHSRGIRLVRGIDYRGVTLDEFKQWIAKKNPQESQASAVAKATDADYDAYAKYVIDKYVTQVGLDGLDIDMENHPSDEDVKISDSVIKAFAKYIGPKSPNASTTLFLYDTNNTNMKPFANVKDCFDYVAYQQYGTDDRVTKPQSDAFMKHIASDKFVPGLTFPEELDNNRWCDAKEPYKDSNFYKVASYVNKHNLGGMFIYALDRDGRTYSPANGDLNKIKPSNLLWTKTAILESRGVSVDEAKRYAYHFLNRMALVKPVDQAVRDMVDAASDLYGVNKAILGNDYDKGLSNTFDPMIERELLQIDTSKLSRLMTRAKTIIADAKVADEKKAQLSAAYDMAIKELTGKIYTKQQVATLQDNLSQALDSFDKSLNPQDQDDLGKTNIPQIDDKQDNNTMKPTQPTQPKQPNMSTKKPMLAATGSAVATVVLMSVLLVGLAVSMRVMPIYRRRR